MKYTILAFAAIGLVTFLVGFHIHAVNAAYDAGETKAKADLDQAVIAAKAEEAERVVKNQADKAEIKIVYKERIKYVKELQDDFGQCIMSDERFMYLRSLRASTRESGPNSSNS